MDSWLALMLRLMGSKRLRGPLRPSRRPFDSTRGQARGIAGFAKNGTIAHTYMINPTLMVDSHWRRIKGNHSFMRGAEAMKSQSRSALSPMTWTRLMSAPTVPQTGKPQANPKSRATVSLRWA